MDAKSAYITSKVFNKIARKMRISMHFADDIRDAVTTPFMPTNHIISPLTQRPVIAGGTSLGHRGNYVQWHGSDEIIPIHHLSAHAQVALAAVIVGLDGKQSIGVSAAARTIMLATNWCHELDQEFNTIAQIIRDDIKNIGMQ